MGGGGGGADGHGGTSKRIFLKYCGTEHTNQISTQSDNISRWRILGGIPPQGEIGGISKKIEENRLGIHP